MWYCNSPSDNLDGYSVTNRQDTLIKGWFTSWPSCSRLHHISHNSVQSKTKVKWKALSHVTLWNPMNYMVYGILQARILEGVAFPFSRGSSQPKDHTQVSCIAGGFFTSWATRKLLLIVYFWDFPLIFWAQLTGGKLQLCEWVCGIANSNDLGTSARFLFLGSFTYIYCLLKESQVMRINFSVVYHDNAMPKWHGEGPDGK